MKQPAQLLAVLQRQIIKKNVEGLQRRGQRGVMSRECLGEEK